MLPMIRLKSLRLCAFTTSHDGPRAAMALTDGTLSITSTGVMNGQYVEQTDMIESSMELVCELLGY